MPLEYMRFTGKGVVMENASYTIANKYIRVLEKKSPTTLHHRGKPAPKRKESTYSEDPYNMTKGEYQTLKKRIKKKYRELNRAAQKQLTQRAIGAIRRKPQKWLSYREQKNKELADLETKYRRAEIDREYGNVPGYWQEGKGGKYPVGTQGKPKAQRGRPYQPSQRPRPRPERELPPPKYDYEGEYREIPRPRELPPRPEPKGLPAPRTSPPPRRELPPSSPRPAPRGRSLPPPRYTPPPPSPRPLPPGRRPVAGYLPEKTRKMANKVKSRRGNRR